MKLGDLNLSHVEIEGVTGVASRLQQFFIVSVNVKTLE